MSSMFHSPKSAKAPALAAPGAVPVVEDDVGEMEKKRLRKRKGRESTFLTGDLTPETEKKSVLG